MKCIFYSLIEIFSSFTKLKHISTVPGINATIYANFYTQGGKDMATVENTNTSGKSKISLCSFKAEGDIVTEIKDYTSSIKSGTNHIILPNLNENKYYFFRSIIDNDAKYSSSFMKQNGDWHLANAGKPLPTNIQTKNNNKKKSKNQKKKSLNNSQDNNDLDTKNDEGEYNWIIWTCATVIVVLLVGLVISVFCCR